MKTFTLALFATVLLAVAAKTPTPGSAKSTDGYKAYQYMRLRNIFDPTRTRDPLSETSPRPTTTSESGRAHFFALTGALLRPDKTLGFFAGSSSDMNRVLGPGDIIGGYKIKSVSLTGADLEKDGKSLILPVGKQVPLSGDNAGTVQPWAAPEPVSSSSYGSPPPSGGPPGPPPPGGMPPPAFNFSSSSSNRSDRPDKGDKGDHHSSKSPEEILRKMMERAQKERNK